MSLVSDQEWAEYKQKFNKSYADAAEDQMRRELFAKSKATVEAHNKKYDAGEASWKMCLNHLSDVTPDEMASRCGNKTKAPKS